jgi:hypothetical protein
VPTAARVVALLRARSVLAGGGSVALLCGDLDGLLDAVSAPAALLRLIDGAEDPAWAALRDADGVVQRGLRSVVELLESEMTAAWIASSSEADAAHDIASCALAGIEVTRVEVTGGGAARDDLLPSGAPLRATTAGVEQVDGGFVLHVPLEPWAAERARVGRHRTDLVVDADGRRRRLALPPALQRCVAVDAVRAPSGLRVRFAPDPALWPAAASPSGESAA